MANYRNPVPTVDIIIEYAGGIVLIERKNPPFGWAIPGGFVEEGESMENAAVREAKEETSLDVELKQLLYVYSDPSRDPRSHTVSAVFIAEGQGELCAKDDAANAQVFSGKLPDVMAFDHGEILADYFAWKKNGTFPDPSMKMKN